VQTPQRLQKLLLHSPRTTRERQAIICGLVIIPITARFLRRQDRSDWPAAVQALVSEAEAAAAEAAATDVRQQAEAAEAALEAELESLRIAESVAVQELSAAQQARCERVIGI